MSLQKAHPTMDALQHIMSSFKQFEKKIDKLQDDVSFHGQTLNDLRILISNLSDGTIDPDFKQDTKRSQQTKKTTGLQYDNFVEPLIKTRRKKAIQSFPAKVKSRSFQDQGNKYDLPFLSKLTPSPKTSPAKRSYKSQRPSKADSPRKASSLRANKNLPKKNSKMQKTLLP